MGEETTWFDFLPGVHGLTNVLEVQLGRKALVDVLPTGFTLSHVFGAMLAVVVVFIGAVLYSSAVRKGGDDAIVPPEHFNFRNFIEMFAEAVLGVATGVMGPKNARRFLPLIGTLAFFIFFCNALALIPGFIPPTATLKTNVALALTVFFLTHVFGVMASGPAYFKHFLGPVWYLAWLMLPIEIVSHLARPLSLSLRLLGNIAADHKVVSSFFVMLPLLLPVPFLILGVMVVVVQTLVFCLLTMVYIQGAVAHEEHH
jgi:F-type H+-transporting ATPase subunit a